jgi:hypothetical protein
LKINFKFKFFISNVGGRQGRRGRGRQAGQARQAGADVKFKKNNRCNFLA